MKEKDFTTKNLKIRESLKATKAKRKTQICKVFDLKIDESKLSKRQREDLKMQFIESKWLYNDILSWMKEDPLNKPSNYQLKRTVRVKTKSGDFEERELKHMSFTAKQALVEAMTSSIKTLSTLKKRGLKIGPLKFKSEHNVIHLKRLHTSYQIYVSDNKVKLPGVFRRVKVYGFHQIPKNAEFANAKLLKTPDGYHLKVTCFFEKETMKKTGRQVGIDFGCSTSLTLSTGEKINISVEEPERLKKLQRKLEFLKKGSNNRKKLVNALKREYQKMTNKKNDLVNKIVHRLLTEFDLIAIQDDSFNSWKEENHGKAVQHSVLGRVKAKLKASNKVKVISKWEATTQTCSKCGHREKLELKDRVFECSGCGLSLDRDVNAALNVLKAVPMERREDQACLTGRSHSSK